MIVKIKKLRGGSQRRLEPTDHRLRPILVLPDLLIFLFHPLHLDGQHRPASTAERGFAARRLRVRREDLAFPCS